MRHDAIVIGLGGVGSAAAYQLATRDLRVLGLDRQPPPHDRGSTHGRSRIIRQAYMEGAAYVPLVRRSYELWRRLEEEADTTLLRLTGGLTLGDEGSDALQGSLASAREHALEHELLDGDEIRRRFPPFRPPEGTRAVFEPEAGTLDPERCVETWLRLARRSDADIRTERVTAWSSDGDGCRVETEADAYEADTLVLAPGPWAPELLPELAPHLTVTREVMHWFRPTGELEPFLPGRFPVFIQEPRERPILYGFPALDGRSGGVKVALHHAGEATDPEQVDRTIRSADVDAIREGLRELLPALDGEHLTAAVCLYTTTPDEDFMIGTYPGHERVYVAAGLSGHGFKFTPVLGEVLAELATDGTSRHPIAPFDPGRLG